MPTSLLTASGDGGTSMSEETPRDTTGANPWFAMALALGKADEFVEWRARERAEAIRSWIWEWPCEPNDGTLLGDVARDGLERAESIAAGQTCGCGHAMTDHSWSGTGACMVTVNGGYFCSCIDSWAADRGLDDDGDPLDGVTP